jgi:hypothetical protein
MDFKTLLERYRFERYVLDVCIATMERGGVTSKLDTLQFLSPVDAWALPKYPDKTVILPPQVDLQEELMAFIQANEACLRQPDCWLGTWVEPDTCNYYLDITSLCLCLEDAMHEATVRNRRARRKIVALYNFKLSQTVYLNTLKASYLPSADDF